MKDFIDIMSAQNTQTNVNYRKPVINLDRIDDGKKFSSIYSNEKPRNNNVDKKDAPSAKPRHADQNKDAPDNNTENKTNDTKDISDVKKEDINNSSNNNEQKNNDVKDKDDNKQKITTPEEEATSDINNQAQDANALMLAATMLSPTPTIQNIELIGTDTSKTAVTPLIINTTPIATVGKDSSDNASKTTTSISTSDDVLNANKNGKDDADAANKNAIMSNLDLLKPFDSKISVKHEPLKHEPSNPNLLAQPNHAATNIIGVLSTNNNQPQHDNAKSSLNNMDLIIDKKAAISDSNSNIPSFSQFLNAATTTQGSISGATNMPGISKFNEAVQLNGAQMNNQFSEKIMWMTNQKVETAQIHLDPGDLGKILAHVKIENNTANIMLFSGNIEVRDKLQDSLDHLRASLEQSGMTQVNVSVHDNANRQQQSEQYQQPNSKWHEFQPPSSQPEEVKVKGVTINNRLIDYFA